MSGQRVHPIVFTVPESGIQQIDMTGQGERLRVLEILTDAGLIRVNTNLEDTRTRVPVVVVEVEPNTTYMAKTPPGGDWIAETRERVGGRIDINLTKIGPGQSGTEGSGH